MAKTKVTPIKKAQTAKENPQKSGYIEQQFKRADMWGDKGLFDAMTKLRQIHIPAFLGVRLEHIYEQMRHHREAINEARLKLLASVEAEEGENGQYQFKSDEDREKVQSTFVALLEESITISHEEVEWEDIKNVLIPPEVLTFVRTIIKNYPIGK